MLLKLIRRKVQKDTGIKIKDGRIITSNTKPYVRNDLPFAPMIYTRDGLAPAPRIKDFAPIDLWEVTQKTQVPETVENEPTPATIPKNKTRELGCLTLPCKYHPSYLTDKRDGGDLGLFIHYLQYLGRSEDTRNAYVVDLRAWRNNLDSQLSIDKIHEVIKKQTPHRAKRMLYSLRTYGRYRSFHGDPRLTIMFATTTIKMPVLPKSRREMLNKDAVSMYRKSARSMVKNGNRVGIWMGLTLLGLRSSEMATVEVNGDGNVRYIRSGEKMEKKCPAWLYNGLHEMNRSKWALGKSTIWKGMKSYGVTPFVLYHSRKCDRNWVN